MATVPECGTLGYNRGRSDNEQRASDAQDFYYPGGQQRLSPEEQERQRALSWAQEKQVPWVKALWQWV